MSQAEFQEGLQKGLQTLVLVCFMGVNSGGVLGVVGCSVGVHSESNSLFVLKKVAEAQDHFEKWIKLHFPHADLSMFKNIISVFKSHVTVHILSTYLV